ncbi:MAG: hypothetical protein LH616_07715 [Ilumatobacteraceae bacterium]|nr:hypothetical protein [Ilumatobacteraceae bacterium]
MLEVWYGFVASTPELVYYFGDAKTGKPDGAYLEAVRKRFAVWTIPITTTLKPFLAKKGASASDVEKMHAAWVKTVLLQTILWSQPYIREGEF